MATRIYDDVTHVLQKDKAAKPWEIAQSSIYCNTTTNGMIFEFKEMERAILPQRL
jgi:hypothetical protein